MENGMMVQDNHKPMTVASIKAQVNLIQNVMREVMQGPTEDNPEGVHYGIIPGTKKPSLLKPGAEKIAMSFRLRPIINPGTDIVRMDLENGHREITVYCHVFNYEGVELATGVGSCSTLESKYRYRGGEKKPTGKPVPTDYWNLRKDGKIKEAQELIGGRGFSTAKIDGKWEICEIGDKMENPDIADQYNTVLKMAKKRAYVDGILSATAASDIFTQDLDEDGEIIGAAAEDTKPPVSQPGRKSEAAAPASAEKTAPAAGMLSKTFVPKTVHDRVGKGPFKIESPDGLKFNTFDEAVADAGRDAVTMKAEVTIHYVETKYGPDIKTMTQPKEAAEPQ